MAGSVSSPVIRRIVRSGSDYRYLVGYGHVTHLAPYPTISDWALFAPLGLYVGSEAKYKSDYDDDSFFKQNF
jgi:hypothetical protein